MFRSYYGIFQLLINGVDSWTLYSSGRSMKNIKYFKTSLTVLEIDLACNQHKVNFCRQDLAPSIANGTLVLKMTSNRVEGNVTCNEGFMLASLKEGDVHCDRSGGWVVSRLCKSRIWGQRADKSLKTTWVAKRQTHA